MMLCKCCIQYVSKFGKINSGHRTGKGRFSFQSQRKAMPKNAQVLVPQSCPTLFDPMDCSLPGSSVHEIFQARILEWFAISFSSGSSQPRNWTRVSSTAGRFLTDWATNTREAQSVTETRINNELLSIHAQVNSDSGKVLAVIQILSWTLWGPVNFCIF